ncbi:hypothetical protein [Caulobacter segnis]|uniref:hypothetical protein n=1 Tax=Caulobacter segnis TaxID=88688 RepID=UPI0026EE160E|nr:hypothetical protein [Caulobacter segnis]
MTVRISAEDAADLQARVDRGEFASLDEGLAAELAELNYRRAADIVGGSEKLEALLDTLEQTDDPSTDVDADDFFKALRVGLKERLAPSRG